MSVQQTALMDPVEPSSTVPSFLTPSRTSLLVLTLAMSLFVRLQGLSVNGFTQDEVAKLHAIQAYRQGDFSANAEHPMLMKLAMWGSLAAADRWNTYVPDSLAVAPETALRLPNAVAGAPDAGLGDRVARLETASARVSDAAAQALAAATLSTAAQGPAPFDQDVAAYARLVPGDPELAALSPLAAHGAPSRAALAAAFPDLASAAAAASRAPGKDAGYLAHFWAVLGRVVIVRNVDPGAGGVDGILARAQGAASSGDLEAAVRLIGDLPPDARDVLADWRAAAQRRIAIDQLIGRLRARALAGLAHPPGAS